MADSSDVQQALVSAIAQALYPNGTGQASAVNGPVLIYPGWPDAASLDADLAAQKVHVTVFSRPEESNTTRYPAEWRTVSVNSPTLTATMSGNQLTIGGTVSVPQNVSIETGGHAYVYAVQATDTLTSIATALSAQIPNTTSSGAVITFANTAEVTARIGVSGASIKEINRQRKRFQVTVWAYSHASRVQAAQIIKNLLAPMEFITLADTSRAWLTYQSAHEIDNLQKISLYRRDLFFEIEYADTLVETDTTITQGATNVTGYVGSIPASDPYNTPVSKVIIS
jgi:hypothetical protein